MVVLTVGYKDIIRNWKKKIVYKHLFLAIGFEVMCQKHERNA